MGFTRRSHAIGSQLGSWPWLASRWRLRRRVPTTTRRGTRRSRAFIGAAPWRSARRRPADLTRRPGGKASTIPVLTAGRPRPGPEPRCRQATARVTQARAGLRRPTPPCCRRAACRRARPHVRASPWRHRRARIRARLRPRRRILRGQFHGARWEIDVFGGLRRNQEAARRRLPGGQGGSRRRRLSVAAQTADTYVAIRGLQSRIAIASQQIDTQRRLVGHRRPAIPSRRRGRTADASGRRRAGADPGKFRC
jgi:hypothetical protein